MPFFPHLFARTSTTTLCDNVLSKLMKLTNVQRVTVFIWPSSLGMQHSWCARRAIAVSFTRRYSVDERFLSVDAAAVAIISYQRCFFSFLLLLQLSFSDHFIDGGAFAFTCGANMLDWLLAAYIPP